MKWEWLNKWLQRPYDKTVEELGVKLNAPPKDISEPVFSIVKSFKEKGRWKILNEEMTERCYEYGLEHNHKFTATDTLTGECYKLKSSYSLYLNCKRAFPADLSSYHLPSWMTQEEKEYVKKEFDIISQNLKERFTLIEDRKRSRDQKQAKVNQDKERQRLMSLYCKEKTE